MNSVTNHFLTIKTELPEVDFSFIKRFSLINEIKKSEKNIILLQGKAGYGKSELARQYCQDSGLTVMWYRLDRADNNPLRFLKYLDLIFDHKIKGYHSLNLNDQGRFCQKEYFNMVDQVNQIFKDMKKTSYTLVLDSLELISNKDIFYILHSLIEVFSSKLQFILIYRNSVPDFFSRLMANGQCKILNETDLAFTEEEQLILIRQKLECSEEKAKNIFEDFLKRIKGWPACLMLALMCIQKRGIAKEWPDWEYFIHDSMIFNFLKYEIFEKLPEKTRQFLIQSSFFTDLDLSAWETILDMPDTNAIIRNLKNNNLFEPSVKGGYGNACYHGLFRIFLNQIRNKKLSNRVAKRAAAYYLEKMNYKRALRMSLDTGYIELILKIISIYGEQMLAESEDELLGAAIDYLEHSGKDLLLKSERGVCISIPAGVPGVIAEFYYKKGMINQTEYYLKQMDSGFGISGKYGMYRNLYNSLLNYSDNTYKYGKCIDSAIAELKKNKIRLPYLTDRDTQLLNTLSLQKEKEKRRQKQMKKSIRVNVFGDFCVVINETKALSWRTKKGSELFAYLVEREGQAVSRKQLLQKLWDDEMPDHAVTMLHNMLYHIRKELTPFGMTDLIQYRDKMYRINMDEIESDITEIKYLCTLVDKEDKEGLCKNSRRFQNYWGRYLEDMDCRWVMEEAEYYDTRYLKGCVLLAQIYMNLNDFENSIIFLKNALLINPYSEELLIDLLRCYGYLKNLKQVKFEFEKFCSLLKSDLDMKPGKELLEAYQSIRNSDRLPAEHKLMIK